VWRFLTRRADGRSDAFRRALDVDKSNIRSIIQAPMRDLPSDVSATLASLQARWGAAAPRVVGALATAPLPAVLPGAVPASGSRSADVLSSGFAALDAILGPGGLPRSAAVALHGTGSSGTTTLALRLVAEAQAAGLIAA